MESNWKGINRLRGGNYYVSGQVSSPEEPAVKTGSIAASVAALLSSLLFFFPDLLTEKQTTLLMVAAVFVTPIISAVITRGKVWSPATVVEMLNESISQTKTAIDDLKDKQDPEDPDLDWQRS